MGFVNRLILNKIIPQLLIIADFNQKNSSKLSFGITVLLILSFPLYES